MDPFFKVSGSVVMGKILKQPERTSKKESKSSKAVQSETGRRELIKFEKMLKEFANSGRAKYGGTL